MIDHELLFVKELLSSPTVKEFPPSRQSTNGNQFEIMLRANSVIQ